MELDHQTLQNDKLTHQVRFNVRQRVVYVSCNCRMRPGEHKKSGKYHADPIGPTKNLDESRDLYNNPENHWAPFTDDDRAKW